MADRVIDAALEGRHAPGPSRWWNESWYFDFARPDGTGGYVRIGLYPNQRQAWCWAYLVLPDRPGPIVVRAHDVPMPPADPHAVLARGDGVWCELTCETPMEHWGIGLEAFGVALDEPADAYRGEIGERIAVGLDLEWEALLPAYHYPYPPEYPSAHYQHAGRVRGEILLGADTIEFDGVGERDHSWGDRDWWLFGWNWGAWCFGPDLAVHTLLGEAGLFTEGCIWTPEAMTRVTALDADVDYGPDGIARHAHYVVNGGPSHGGLELDVDVLAAAPVPLDADDGRTARFPRVLCRATTHDGRVATGWAEWLQVRRPDESA